MPTNVPDKVDGILGVSARVWDPVMTAYGYQQITDLSSAVGLTVPTGARVAWIQAEGDNLRWRDDGVSPTTTAGMYLADGDFIWYNGPLEDLEFVEISGSGKLNVSYYGSV